MRENHRSGILNTNNILHLIAIMCVATILVRSQQVPRVFVEPDPGKRVLCVAFSPDGRFLASGHFEGIVRLWNVESGSKPQLKTIATNAAAVYSMAFRPDAKILAIGGASAIHILQIDSGKEVKILSGHLSIVRSVAISTDGKTMASGSDDNTIKVWDIASGAELKTLSGHTGRVASVAFSPDGKLLASGSGDETIKLWKTDGWRETRTFIDTDHVWTVRFSPDGKSVVSGSDDRIITIWDIVSGNKGKSFKGHENYVTSVAFSPDGKTLASSSFDNTVKLWSVATGQEQASLKEHSANVISVTFSPDGKTLASGGFDGQIKLWDAQQGTLLANLIAVKNADWVVTISGGRFDVSAEGAKAAYYVVDGKRFPISSFSEPFLFPNLLGKVYAREKLPPVNSTEDFSKPLTPLPFLRIASPASGIMYRSQVMQIVVEAEDSGGGVADIRLFQNGKLLDGLKPRLTVKDTITSATFDVDLAPGANSFRATAFNRDRIESLSSKEITLNVIPTTSPLKRTALVIGNGNYQKAPMLKNPVNDAIDVATTLRDLGFDVISGTDLTQKQMLEKIRAFGHRLEKNRGAGLFYYAGHAVQVKGSNYLIPVEADIQSEDETKFQAYPVDDLFEKLAEANTGLNIVILDACRNNPFAKGGNRSLESGGLAQVNAPTGTIVVYATDPNSTAGDGNGRNGIYTTEFLRVVKTPFMKIEETFKEVTKAVREKTHGNQTPWISSSLSGDFYFVNLDAGALYRRWEMMLGQKENEVVFRETSAELLQHPQNIIALRMRSASSEPFDSRASADRGDIRKAAIIPANEFEFEALCFAYTTAYSDLEKGLSACTSAIALNSGFEAAYFSRGQIYRQNKEFDRALDDFAAVARLNPKRIDVADEQIKTMALRADALFTTGEYQEAISQLTKLIDMNLKRSLAYRPADYYRMRGDCYEKTGDDEKALQDYSVAIIKGDRLGANAGTGKIYLKRKDYDRAITYLSAAINEYARQAKRPSFLLLMTDYVNKSGIVERYLDRAIAYEAIGETQKAQEDRAKAADLQVVKDLKR